MRKNETDPNDTHLHVREAEITECIKKNGADFVEKAFCAIVREYIREELDASYRGYYHPKQDDSHNS